MNKSLDIFHYGDCGSYDEHNPIKLVDENHVKEILYLIGQSEPFTLGLEELNKLLLIDMKTLVLLLDKMIKMNFISEQDCKYSVKFTLIFEKDLDVIDDFSKKLASQLSGAILLKNDDLSRLARQLRSANHFEIDELLYHLIGSHILDGLAIDTLSQHKLIKTSKQQNGNRDYILFGFEKSDKVDDFSVNILCSCNNYRTNHLSFVSFGDAAGNRNDFYRFNRQVVSQVNQMKMREESKAAYINLQEKFNHDIVIRCAELIIKLIDKKSNNLIYNEEDKMYLNYLMSFDYVEIKNNQYMISVPVFYPEDESIICGIHKLLIEIILPILEDAFNQKSVNLDISALRHGVDIKEVLNEMWHQVFGNINESLVRSKMFKTPNFIEGEGRYLKAIYVNN